MAEAVAVIGLLAAIAQFVEYASRLSDRLKEISASSKGFAHLRARLVAVTAILQRIGEQAGLNDQHGLKNEALVQVVAATSKDVVTLSQLLDEALPQGKGKTLERYLRAMKSLSSDRDIQKVTMRLNESIQVISLYQTTSLVDLSRVSASVHGSSGRLMTTCASIDDTGSPGGVSNSASSGGSSPVPEVSHPAMTSLSDLDAQSVDLDAANDSSKTDCDLSDETRVTYLTTRTHSSRTICKPSCSCVCHRPYQLTTPALLKSLVGRLAISYTGSTILSLPCTERKCRRQGQTSASLTYRLPQWLLPLALHTTLSSTALNTHLNLNTLRILPDSAEVFSVLSRGDLSKLRDLFISNQASIHDMSTTNWTLLHTAYTLGHMHMASFLLQQGADPTIAADNGSNVIERAWFFAQKSANTPGDYVLSNNDVLKTIDLDDFMQQQQYTLVHKIVLGLSKLPLDMVLASSTCDIDKQDIRGNTPLWWAAAQGNLPAIRILLDCGANYTIGGGLNQVPMHVARDAATVELLCEYNAPIDPLDTLERTPLHCFCYRQMGADVAMIKAAINHGADINARASGRQTPLHYAVMFGNVELITPLLNGGADVNAVMRSDLSPLAAAIRYDQIEAVRILLKSVPNVPSHDLSQFHLLELVSAWAGAQLLGMIVEALELQTDRAVVPLHEAQLLWERYEGRSLRWDKLDEAFGRFLAALGVDVHQLFARGSNQGQRRCSADSGCLGCLPIPGAFCG